MKQTELQVEDRNSQLERQHRLLSEIRSIESTIDDFRHRIKSYRLEKEAIQEELEELTVKIDANQMTLKAE